MFPIWGEGRGVSRVGSEGWLRSFAHPSGRGVCRGHAQYPVFAPDTLSLLQTLQKWRLGFFGLFVSLGSRICPNCMHTVIFSPVQFLCILLLEERYTPPQVQALQALQQRGPGASLSHSLQLRPLPLRNCLLIYECTPPPTLFPWQHPSPSAGVGWGGCPIPQGSPQPSGWPGHCSRGRDQEAHQLTSSHPAGLLCQHALPGHQQTSP